MSEAEPDGRGRLDAHEPTRVLMNGWVEALALVLESMTGQRPETGWRAAGGTAAEVGAAPDADVLWWEQPFLFAPDAAVWVGSPRPAWEHAGNLVLQASGLEGAPEEEARKTWVEILSQWLATLARSIGSVLGREVSCGAGAEKAPPDGSQAWAVVSLSFGETALAPLLAAFSDPLLKLLTAAGPPPESARPSGGPAEDDSGQAGAPSPAASPTMDLLLDVDLPVSISFGKTQLALKDVLKLTTGSIVELNRGINEPVEVLVNHCLVARGEVVVVDGNYGVRIRQIVSRQDRVRTLP